MPNKNIKHKTKLVSISEALDIIIGNREMTLIVIMTRRIWVVISLIQWARNPRRLGVCVIRWGITRLVERLRGWTLHFIVEMCHLAWMFLWTIENFLEAAARLRTSGSALICINYANELSISLFCTNLGIHALTPSFINILAYITHVWY